MTLLKSPELRTDHRIVEWGIKRKAKHWLQRSDQIILVVGNMPDVQPDYQEKGITVRKRYVDDDSNWKAQRLAIDGKMRDWIGDRQDGEVTVALCSGSRGVDLESYATVRSLRDERPGLAINVVSILPVNKKSFRQESVVGSIQETYWTTLYQQLLDDKHAVVHEPRFRRFTLAEYIGRRETVTAEKAKERSALVNGNQNMSRIYSDTQQELIALAEQAYRANPQVEKDLRMLLVTDGGQANGDGGTNEMVARFFRVFGKDVARRSQLRELYENLHQESGIRKYETVSIIQDGMILTNGRRLVSPLENTALGQNGEYLQTVDQAYGDKFVREGHDSLWDRRKTMKLRRQQRRFALHE